MNPLRYGMSGMRQRYNKEFKIAVLTESEGGKPLAQIARKHGINPSLPSRWRKELAMNPKTAFRGNGRKCKESARTFEQGRIVDQLYADNDGLIGKNKKDARQIFEIIQDALSKDLQLSIRKACKLHGASRSGYYKWKKRPEPAPSTTGVGIDLKDLIQKIVLKFPEYGYRRVTTELKNRGYVVNHKRVLKIMRKDNFVVQPGKGII
jgi:transposase-like protein